MADGIGDSAVAELSLFSVLDLPDDVLSRVYFHLLGSGKGLRGHTLSSIRNAFPLAISCKRLLKVFMRTLHTINATSANNPHYHGTTSSSLAPSHIIALIRFAQHSLRTCRLPAAPSPYNSRMLRALAEHCHMLTALEFTGGHGLAEADTKTLFAACTQLETVQVHQPGFSVLKVLTIAVHLRHVTLLVVCPEHLGRLLFFLSERGKRLLSLHVGFDVESQRIGCVPTLHKLESVTAGFFCFLRENMKEKLPLLKTLYFDTSTADYVEHSFFDFDVDVLASLVQDVSDGIETLRSSDRLLPGILPLRNLRIRSTEELVPKCLDSLVGLVSADTVVSFQFPGVELMFPRQTISKEFGRTPYFRYLQLGDDFYEYPTKFPGLLDRIETLDIGRSSTTCMYGSDKSVAALRAIVTGAGTHLKKVRALFQLEGSEGQEASAYFADVLELAVAVTCLEVSFEFVTAVHNVEEHGLRMLAGMRCLEVLRMRTVGSGPSSIMHAHVQSIPYEETVTCLISLLERLAVSCPRLKCLEFETPTANDGIFSPSRKLILQERVKLARKHLAVLEEALPDIDVESVRRQLESYLVLSSSCRS